MTNRRYHGSPDQYFRQAGASISKALTENRITQEDADLITEFVDELSSGISPGRYFKIASTLVTVRRFFDCEYSQCTKSGLHKAIRDMKYATKADGTPYTLNTKTDYIKFTKRFFTWLSKNGRVDISKETIAGIKAGGYDMHTKSDEDVLTAEEITAIIDAAQTRKYKAYFGVLYEAGARSIELANLKWQDVSFHPWGAQVRLTDHKSGRTPKIRTLPIITYSTYLAAWRSEYPGNATGDNFVFITPRGEPMQYRGVEKALKLFVKKAGIEKIVTLHRFRHSRITHALRGGMSETLAKRAFWGNTGTNMIQVYEHLTDDDLNREFARQAGIELEPVTHNEAPEAIQCSRCNTVSPPGTRFCGTCGRPLDESTAQSIDELSAKIESAMLEKLQSDPAQFQKIVQQFL